MKHIKKLAALLIALIVVLAMGVNASATITNVKTPDGGFTITIVPNPQDMGTHTYEAYQIFAGTLAKDDKGTEATTDDVLILSDIVWGTGINDEGKTKLLKIDETSSYSNVREYAKSFTDTNVFEKANDIENYLAATSGTFADNKLTGLQPGYYLIQDSSKSPTGNKPGSKTKFILQVLSDATVNVKSSVPTVEKKTQDKNDSVSTEFETHKVGQTATEPVQDVMSNLLDSADYDIGDEIPYIVTATIGNGIEHFDKYSFQFVDTMSKGLTLKTDSWDIKIDGTSVKDQNLFTLSDPTVNSEGASTYTWSATDIKKNITVGSKIVLTYTCILNKDAVIGSLGNPNTVYVKFDNNPNHCGEGKPGGDTPPDVNIVFTYKTVFNKVDKDHKPLEGADFELDKFIVSTDGPDTLGEGENALKGTWTDVTRLGSGTDRPTKAVSGTEAVEASGEEGSENYKPAVPASTNTVFTFSGLDDGTYRLRETQTPAGYNHIEPIVFTITAEHEVLADNPKLTKLEGTGNPGFEFNLTPDLTEGSLTADIINEKGTVLPATGGIGRKIFYIGGGALLVASAVLLIARRRMAAK